MYGACHSILGLSQCTALSQGKGTAARYRCCHIAHRLSQCIGAVTVHIDCHNVQGLSQCTGTITVYMGSHSIQGKGTATGYSVLQGSVTVSVYGAFTVFMVCHRI